MSSPEQRTRGEEGSVQDGHQVHPEVFHAVGIDEEPLMTLKTRDEEEFSLLEEGGMCTELKLLEQDKKEGSLRNFPHAVVLDDNNSSIDAYHNSGSTCATNGSTDNSESIPQINSVALQRNANVLAETTSPGAIRVATKCGSSSGSRTPGASANGLFGYARYGADFRSSAQQQLGSEWHQQSRSNTKT